MLSIAIDGGENAAFLAIDGGENAAFLACQILAVKDESLSEKLQKHKEEMLSQVLAMNEEDAVKAL